MFHASTADGLWVQVARYFSDNQNIPKKDSQYGITFEIPNSCLVIDNPRQRWIFSRNPPINVAYAIAEFVWLINGKNDSEFLNFWNSKLPEYAGMGNYYHGAYGHRLRNHFSIDQIERAYEVLKTNPNTRQVVLQIWDSNLDLPNKDGTSRNKDIPCNIISLLKIRNGKLFWTQISRSSDLFLGIPYDIVQFTFLHELMASWLNIDIGHYYQYCDSLHVYKNDMKYINKSINNIVDDRNIINNDMINISYKDTNLIFSKLYNKIEQLTDLSISIKDAQTIDQDLSKNKFIHNLTNVMIADHFRKKNETELSKDQIKKCENPILIQLFNNWLKRTKCNEMEGLI